ncbi:MAG: PDZ domain-containing protein [Vicinamibacteria bacterium]
MRFPFRVLLLATLCPASIRAQETAVLDRAFDAFWNAGSTKGADKAAAGIVASSASFTAVLARLTEGRPYKTAQTGELHWTTLPGGGALHATTVVIPKDYDPAIKYPVRVYLHGGVARPDPQETEASEGSTTAPPNRPRRRLPFKERYIAVYPSGYAEAMWWFSNQMANLDEILDRLKRAYNVDENRIHLMGVSDGGTGVYFAGLKNPTPWSVFFPLNGFLRVLSNPMTRADGELFTTNLTNRPIYAVNGELDPLYPAIAAYPFMVMLKRAGADLTFRVMPGAGHDTSWWPTEVNPIDAFEEAHPRNPLPDSLSWETERVDRYNRIAWLVVDRLDPAKNEGVFAENNTLEIQEPSDFGLRVDSRKGDGRKVIDVIEGTTAATMGMKKGDTVVRMGPVVIQSAGDMGRAFDQHPAGTALEFEVDRKGQRLTMSGVFPPAPKPPRKEEAFKHGNPSGRIAISHKGNRFEARSRGVGAFTILLAPAMVDFDQPVTVVVNGKTAFEGAVARSLPTLLRYAARDSDRSMLFGAELAVTVP